MNNSIRIIFIKIIIRITINNIYINFISLQENMTLPESSLKYSMFSSAYKAVKSSLIILLVTDQLE